MSTLFDKLQLFRGLLSGGKAYTGPWFADINLTNHCNLSCVGCFYHSPITATTPFHNPKPGHMTFHLFKKICQELHDSGTKELVLQGEGDPLLYPHLLDCVRFAKDLGFYLYIYTNGTLFNREILLGLIDLKLDVLKISLWATSLEEYKLNYPGCEPEMFNKVLDGLKLIQNLKVRYGRTDFPTILLHMPINTVNYQSIEKMADMAIEMGLDGVTYYPFNPGLTDDLKSYILSLTEEKSVRMSLNKARQQLNSHSIEHNVPHVLSNYKLSNISWKDKIPCYLPWFHIRVHINGDIYVCGVYDAFMGNLDKNSFQSVWNGPAFRDLRKRSLRLENTKGNAVCTYCSFSANNRQIQHFFRWFLPLHKLHNAGFISNHNNL